MARADADIKGAASDASYTLERLVLTITGAARPALTASARPPSAKCKKAPPPRGRRLAAEGPQREAAFLAIADLRLAAWFLWMTPLEAALSSLRAASRPAAIAAFLVAGLGGLAELAHGGLQAGLDGLVALVSLLVLLVPLDLGLDVRHYCAFVVGVGCWC